MLSIPVIYSFARSGGTLVNQLLGCHPQCLVLSEVNPAASCKPVAEQAGEWLRLLDASETARVAAIPYAEQLALLARRATERGLHLVVRDWVTVNFLAGTATGAEPSGSLEQEIYLARAGLASRPLVVTRRARAVFRSIRRSFEQFRELPIERFAEAYLAYARATGGYPRISLEALRAEPESTVASLFSSAGVDPAFAPQALERFAEYRRCTGNTTLSRPAPSSVARTILARESEDPSDGQEHPDLHEADRLLGYGH